MIKFTQKVNNVTFKNFMRLTPEPYVINTFMSLIYKCW